MPLTVYYLTTEYPTEILSLLDFLTSHNSLYLFPNNIILIGVTAGGFQEILHNNNVAVDAIISSRLLPSSNQQRWPVLAVGPYVGHLLLPVWADLLPACCSNCDWQRQLKVDEPFQTCGPSVPATSSNPLAELQALVDSIPVGASAVNPVMSPIPFYVPLPPLDIVSQFLASIPTPPRPPTPYPFAELAASTRLIYGVDTPFSPDMPTDEDEDEDEDDNA